MMDGQDQEQLQRLERKVDNLTWLVTLQTAFLAVLAFSYVLQFSRYLLYLLLIIVPFLFIFRRSLPQWAKRLGALWGRWDRRRVKISEPRS